MSKSKPVEEMPQAGAEHLDPTSSWWIAGWAGACEADRVQKIRECLDHAFNVEIALDRRSGFVSAFVIPNREWLRKIKPHLSAAYPPEGERPKNFHLLSSEIRWFRRTLLKGTDASETKYNLAMRKLFFGSVAEKSAGVRTLELKRNRVVFAQSDMDSDFRAPLIDLLVVLAWDHAVASRMKSGKQRIMQAALKHCLAGRQWQVSGHRDLDALIPLTRSRFEILTGMDRTTQKQIVQSNPALTAMILLHDLRNDDLSVWGSVYRAPGYVVGLPIQRTDQKLAASISIEAIFDEWLPGGRSLVAVAKAIGETLRQLLCNMASGHNQECLGLDLPSEVELSL